MRKLSRFGPGVCLLLILGVMLAVAACDETSPTAPPPHADPTNVAPVPGGASVGAAQTEPMQFGTPDDDPPSVETVCDGESGAAFGLCNAYCEAMDCDLGEEANASPTACGKVRDRYMQLTGEDLPCEASVCPCADAGLASWDAISAGATCDYEPHPDDCGPGSLISIGSTISFEIFAFSIQGNDTGFCIGPPNSCGDFIPTRTIVGVSPDQAAACDAFLAARCN